MSNTWHQIILMPAQIEANYASRLKDDFQSCLDKHQFERGFALFVDIRPEMNAAKIYLPPMIQNLCEHLITAYGAIPCEKPEREHIRILLGQPAAMLEYFR